MLRTVCFLLLALLLSARAETAERVRPNILWLTCEDIGPQLGCYGDAYADTPHLDAFAKKSLRYRHCWSNAPVCAPARTTIITGVYPTSTGSEHMRSNVAMPAFMKMYPQLLREAGYYCTNNSKEDYNLIKPKDVWDESSGKAHYKNRKAGQPFFAIFNNTGTHESQIRKRPHKAVHDPAKVRVPAYHPDAPEVRQDWAQYYDNITAMDRTFGAQLEELEQAGLAEDTIVFFYGDHGSGMPRSKRCAMNSGLHVALLVHIPEKFKHLRPKEYAAGGTSERLVSFVDLAPTLMSLIGEKPAEWMQGHAFAGEFDAGPQPFVYGFRGRMDERVDLVRSVRDQRYVYVRQFMPHKPYGQHVSYMFETPTTRVWRKLFDAGKLNAEQRLFFERRQAEELYDLQSDPDEVRNLATSPEHQDVLKKMRAAQRSLAEKIRDVGLLPEGEMHLRAANSTPYEIARSNDSFPFARIREAAELSSMPQADDVARLKTLLKDSDSAVRYWAATGFLGRDSAAVTAATDELRVALKDDSKFVRIPAAQALAQYGNAADQAAALSTLKDLAHLNQHGIFVAVPALNAIDELGEKASSLRKELATYPRTSKSNPPRMGDYVDRLLAKVLGE